LSQEFVVNLTLKIRIHRDLEEDTMFKLV